MTDSAATILTTIPFAGFFSSLHDSELDSEIERRIEDAAGDGADIDSDAMRNHLCDAADWQAVREGYARAYADSFLDHLGLQGEFDELNSPRSYNFATDRIFVRLTPESLARLVGMADAERLARLARARFTSRDGFISHYTPDVADWGPVDSWDHNQIGTLVMAAAETEKGGDWESWDEYALMEDDLCNGLVSNLLCDSADYVRILNIMDYLRGRTQREIRTMAQLQAKRRAENRPFGGTPLGAAAGL